MHENDEELFNSDSGVQRIANPAVMATDGQGNRNPTDVSTSVSSQLPNESDRAQQEEEWRSELFRLENEMGTLRSVLASKIKEAEDLKRKLGITPLVEFKEDIKHGFQNIKESEPVQKTSAAFKDFGEFASKKLDNLRNSNAFKSVEEKVGGAYSSVKKRISTAKSEEDEIDVSAEVATEAESKDSPTRPHDGYDQLPA